MGAVHDVIFSNNSTKLNRQGNFMQAYCYLKGLSYNKFLKLRYSLHEDSTLLLLETYKAYPPPPLPKKK
jgi:hypothetical protein